MTVYSARSSRLASFADVATRRERLKTTRLELAIDHRGVVGRCPGRAVDVPALGGLFQLFLQMGETEEFVSTVHREVLAADTGDGGPISYNGAAVDLALKEAGLDVPPEPVQFDETTADMPPPLTSGYVDDPINASNGNMIHREDDVHYPAIAAALNLTRTWNSLTADRPGAFGAGWSSVLDLHLEVMVGRVVAHLADGSAVAYRDTVDGWVADGVPQIRLSRSGEAPADGEADERGWVLETDTMRRFHFDADGALTGWRVGVASVAVSRDDAGRIVTLAEEVTGRSLSVQWRDDGLVERLVTDDGRTVVYARDVDGVVQAAVSAAGAVRYVWDGELLVSVVDGDGVASFANVYDDARRVVEQTSPHGRVSTYRYEESGLTVFSDAAGVVQGMRHDHLGNLTAVFDVDGSAMHLSYDDRRRVVRVTERDGATVRYRYDGDDLIEAIDPDGLTRRWHWDEHHRLLEETDRTGAVTRYEYDTEHLAPSRVIGPDGAVTAQTLDGRGLPVEIVDADGVVTRFEWDRDGQLVATLDAFGEATTFGYDRHGHLFRVAPPSGAPTVMELDRGGRVVRTERGEAVWEYRYTPAGRVCGGVEPGGIAWSATFGAHGSLATFTDAEASTASFAYDAIGNVTATTPPDGAVYRNVYDEVGRQVAAVDPTGATTTKGYDRCGRLIEVVEPSGNVWKRRLDVLGRTVSSVAPDGGETTWTYHPNGEIASVIAPDGRAWRTEIDAVGRPIAQTDPSGARATIEYTPAGRVASRTSPAGRTERFEYDAAGRLSAVVGFDGVRRTIDRDRRGWIATVSTTDPNAEQGRGSSTTEYRWDDDYRLVAVTTVDAEHGRREATLRRDAGGRVLESVDAAGVTARFSWDSRGLLASATDPAGGVMAYDYDARGRLASQHAPGGAVTTFGYGPDGRPESVTDPAGAVTRALRDANGQTTGLRHADGTGWDRRLDPMGRELERVGTDGTVAGRFGYDDGGRLGSAHVPGSGVTIEFLWDDSDRLETMQGPDGTRRIERDADGWVTATVDTDGARTVFARDQHGRVVGARTERGDGTGLDELDRLDADGAVRQHDRAGRLTIGRDGAVYRYDDAGRLAEVAPPGRPSTTYTYSDNGLLAVEHGPDGVRSYRYDVAGRVVAVDAGNGTTTIEYDANGRRSGETRPDGSSVAYRWDVFGRLAGIDRYDALEHVLGSIEISYDALGRPHLVDGATVGYDPITGLAERLGDDRLGTADADGNTSDEPLGGVPAGDVWVLGVRVLDPATHQFLSPDPLLPVPGSNGAASGYTYGWNDPINWIDPTGMRPLSVEEFGAVMDAAEQSKLGKAWEAIKNDPWGSLAMVGVVAAGVGLCFVPGGQAIGAGILIGVAASAAAGVATGTFNPRLVALSGAVGAIPGGNTLRGAVMIGTATGAGETVAGSYLSGQGFPSPQQLLLGTVTGGGGGAGAYGASQGLSRLANRNTTSALDHSPTPQTGISNERPVVLYPPKSGATPDQIEQIRAYANGSNAAYLDGALSDTGRVSTEGELRRAASRAAAAERTANPGAYGPGQHVGHVPDTTWTGTADPHSWQALDGSINTSLGAQAQRYPVGYEPTGFWYVDDYVEEFGGSPP